MSGIAVLLTVLFHCPADDVVSRNTYDKAAEHVYVLLLKKDCYPRFIRSDHYKTLLTNAINPGSARKRIFNFPQIRKKISQNQPPHAQGAQGPGGSNGKQYAGLSRLIVRCVRHS